MSRTLTEVSSDVAAEEDVKPQVDSIISKVSVDMPDLYLHTLSDEEIRISDITQLIETGVQEFLEKNTDDIHIPQEIVSKVRQLQNALIYAWDTDIQKFRVEPRIDQDGNISELYIPLESPITDDVTVASIQEEDGVNEVLKEELGSQLYKIETMNLRVDKTILSKIGGKIEKDTLKIYKKESKSFSESYNEVSKYDADIRKDIRGVSALTAFLFPIARAYYHVLQNMTESLITVTITAIFFLSLILWVIWGCVLAGMVGDVIKAKLFDDDYKYEELAKIS
jgi:hypothetical protein